MRAYYLNREDRLDRNFLYRGAMAHAEFRPEELVRWIAKNKEDYASRAELCDAASDDGFPEFFQYQKKQSAIGYGHLVVTWGFMGIWREIANSDGHAISGNDDYYLKRKKQQLLQFIEELGEVDILCLIWHKRDDIFLLNRFNLPIPYQVEPLRHAPQSSRAYIGAPEGCSDQAILFSPRGAQRVLDYMRDYPYINSEYALTAMHHTLRNSPNFYCTVDNDPREMGNMVARNNYWIGHLVEYTDGKMTDLMGYHDRPDITDIPQHFNRGQQ